MRGLPKFNDPNLLVGAEDFSDAGVYRLRDDLCIVQSVDFFPPLVDDPFTYGQIAAANSLSDIYAMGAQPTTALNIVGFPDDQLDLSILNAILRGGADRIQQAGAVIAGGHTVRDVEIKYGLSVTGIADPARILTNRAARPGDALVLTKPVGTGFITTAFKLGQCPDDVLGTAVASMIQLNSAGSQAALMVGAKAATDITGFGLAGHAGEMAAASRVTIVLELKRVPILPGALELARRGNQTRASGTNRRFAQPHLHIEGDAADPLIEFLFDAQTSGGLLISVAANRAGELVEKAHAAGAVAATIIGSVEEPRDGVSLVVRN